MKSRYHAFRSLFLTLIVLSLSGALFSAQAQSIVSIDPDSAYAGETVVVTITGSDTHFDEGIDNIYLGYGSYTLVAIDALVHSPILVDASFDLSSAYYTNTYYRVYVLPVDGDALYFGNYTDEGFFVLPPTSTENKSWGDVKSSFR